MGQVQRVAPPSAVAQADGFREWMEGVVAERLRGVVTKHLPADRLVRVALAAWSTNPKLKACDRNSFLLALLRAGQLGLDPSGALGQAYLVPYGNKCQLIIGYRGLIALARRSGEIETIEAHVVFQGDRFAYRLGLSPLLEHEPDRTGSSGRGRDDVVAAYAIARFKGGGYQIEVMFQQDIVKIMENTQSRGRSGPWRDHYPEMARKTAVRRLAKFLPLNAELAAAIEYDDEAEYGRRGPMIDITPPSPDDEYHADNQPSNGGSLPVVVESQEAVIVDVPSGHTEKDQALLQLNHRMMAQPERYRAVVGRKNPFATNAETINSWIASIDGATDPAPSQPEETARADDTAQAPSADEAVGVAADPLDMDVEAERSHLVGAIRDELQRSPGLVQHLGGKRAEDCSLDELHAIQDQIYRLLADDDDGVSNLE